MELSLCPACEDAFSSDNMPVRLTTCHHLLCAECLNSLALSDEDTCPVCQLGFLHSECVPDHALADFFDEVSAAVAEDDGIAAPAAKRPCVAEDPSLLATVQGLYDEAVSDIVKVELVAKAFQESMTKARDSVEMSIQEHERQIEGAKRALDALHEKKKREILRLAKDMEKVSGASMTSLEVTRGQMQSAAAMHRRALDTKTQLTRSAAHVPVAWEKVCSTLVQPKDFKLQLCGEAVVGPFVDASKVTCSSPDPARSRVSGEGLQYFSSLDANKFTLSCEDMFGNLIQDLLPEEVVFSCTGVFPPAGVLVKVTVSPLFDHNVEVVYTFAGDCHPDAATIALSVRGVELLGSRVIYPTCMFSGLLVETVALKAQATEPHMFTGFLLDADRGVAFVTRYDAKVRMFNAQTGAMWKSHVLVKDGRSASNWGRALALTPDGKLLVGTVSRVFELQLDGVTVTATRQIPINVYESASMACNEGHIMVTNINVPIACSVYNRDGVLQRSFGHMTRSTPVCVYQALNKNLVALAGPPGFVDIFDVDTGMLVRTAHCAEVVELALSIRGGRVSSTFLIVPEQGIIVFLTDGKYLSVVSLDSGMVIRSEVLSPAPAERPEKLTLSLAGEKFCLTGMNASQLHFYA